MSETSKLLPCVTICPVQAFKTTGLIFTEEESTKNTFELKELFGTDTVDKLSNKSAFEIKTFSAQLSGFCYTICCKVKFEIQKSMILNLNKNLDFKIYFHERDFEFWLTGYHEYPFEIAALTIEASQTKGLSGALINLAEVEMTSLSRKQKPCKNIFEDRVKEVEFFNNCTKEHLSKNIKDQKLTCKILDMENVLSNGTDLKLCPNETLSMNAFEVYATFLAKFSRNPSMYGCHLPCRHHIYQVAILKNCFVSLTEDT